MQKASNNDLLEERLESYSITSVSLLHRIFVIRKVIVEEAEAGAFV